MSRVVEPPRGSLWRPEIVRAVLSGHSILGIAFAAVIYIVCLSGTLAVFMRDFQRWEQPDAPVVHQISDAAIARAIDAMGVRLTTDKNVFINLPSDHLPRLTLSTGGDEDDETWIADAGGRLVTHQRAPWTEFVGHLHTTLHLPKAWGRFIVGLAGVALLSSLISGVLAHPRIFRDAFHLRLGGSRRLEQADIHNRLGVWPLPFHVLLSLTGALLGLSTLIVGILAMLLFRGDTEKVYALLESPAPHLDARPAPVPDIVAVLATARTHLRGAEPRQIVVSHWGRRDMSFQISASRPSLIAQQDSVTIGIDGKLFSERHPAGMTVGEKILGSLGQLHFGWFGGVAIRIFYGLLGTALCAVTSSGIHVWLSRRRDKGGAAPGLERFWTAIAWGQPLAIALPALAATLAPTISVETLTLIWATITVLVCVGAAGVVHIPAPRLAVLFGATSSATAGLAAAVHLIRWGGVGDVAALLIDIVALLAALIFFARSVRECFKY